MICKDLCVAHKHEMNRVFFDNFPLIFVTALSDGIMVGRIPLKKYSFMPE